MDILFSLSALSSIFVCLFVGFLGVCLGCIDYHCSKESIRLFERIVLSDIFHFLTNEMYNMTTSIFHLLKMKYIRKDRIHVWLGILPGCDYIIRFI